MARFNKMQVLEAIGKTGMVPVFYHADADVAEQVVKACYEGGVRAFEFTNRGDFASEVFIRLVKFAAAECPEMILGIGSVVDAPTAAMYMQYGANFVVGPYLSAIKGVNQAFARFTPFFTPKNVKLGVFVFFKILQKNVNYKAIGISMDWQNEPL